LEGKSIISEENPDMNKKEDIPAPTIARLPIYFQCLLELKNNDVFIVSSEEIATRAGVKASQFRKDLSCFGEFGIQGMGYPVDQLLGKITSIMKLNEDRDMALFGAGNLGKALIRYPGFLKWGFHIRRVFDKDPQKIGTSIGGIIVEDIEQIPGNLGVSIGILTVPASAAQETARVIINSGIKAILNFTGLGLDAPDNILVRNVDITHEVAILNYLLSQKTKSE